MPAMSGLASLMVVQAMIGRCKKVLTFTRSTPLYLIVEYDRMVDVGRKTKAIPMRNGGAEDEHRRRAKTTSLEGFTLQS